MLYIYNYCCKYTNFNYKLYSMSDVFYSFIQFLESVRLLSTYNPTMCTPFCNVDMFSVTVGFDMETGIDLS